MVVGHFTYNLDLDSGNLIGKYFNNFSIDGNRPTNSLAYRIGDYSDQYEGTYSDVWQENGNTIVMQINIERRGNWFIITWNQDRFFGLAHLSENNILTGTYSDVSLDELRTR